MNKIIAIFVMSTVSISGCVATKNPDGSTLYKLDIPAQLTSSTSLQKNELVDKQEPSIESPTIQGTPINKTVLAQLFTKHPWGGSPEPYYPKVAVKINKIVNNNCWIADAKIWWSQSKHEDVKSFNMCQGIQNVESAANGAANYEMFINQVQINGHTGHVRTTGPKPPMTAMPTELLSSPLNEDEFIKELISQTGWKLGPVEITLWLVN